MNLIKRILVVLALPLAAMNVAAQTSEQQAQLQAQQLRDAVNQGALDSSSAVSGVPTLNAQQQSNLEYQSISRSSLLLPGEAGISELLPSTELEETPPPFGANIFAGGYETERFDGLSDDYVVAPGDKIAIKLWGGVNAAEEVTVDNQGNMFIPNVGPIKLSGVRASQVNNVVTAQIRKVYKQNVNIYVNLLTATPVSVYLAGNVLRPGQYAGLASDSLLYFLKRAGGIDSDRGSYRAIQVRRNGETIITADLYDFLLSGELPSINFKDGDVIFVERQKHVISVGGSVRNPFRFEFNGDYASGDELMHYALPRAKVSHVAIVGDRNEGPFSIYLPISDFNSFHLSDGDRLMFNDDRRAQVIDVQIDGSYKGPSYYALKQGARLHDVLALIEVDPLLSNVGSLYIERKSVAEKQKEMLEESLSRLERSVFTSPVNSTGDGAIRSQEASMVLQYTERAREIEPKGHVIVADSGRVANIMLETGDRIVIPQKTDLIAISGEVLMPQSVVYNAEADIEDYIAWAGGFGERADPDQIMVLHPNGKFEIAEDVKLQPGDRLVVLPKVSSHFMQTVKDLTQIVYQIAVANRAVN